MTLRSRRRLQGDPMDSGSLTDLAFLLIIYFIVIAGFNVNMGYLLNLPGKDSQRLVNTQDLWRISLDPQGRLWVGSRESTPADLEKDLTQGVKNRPNLTVLLTISPQCPWQSVVDVIGLAQRSEVVNFSFKQESL